jgi:hypothetical protein
LAKMRALGMTAFSFGPRMRLSTSSGGVAVEAAEVDRTMETAGRMGFLGLVGYGDVFRGENLCASANGSSALTGTVRFRQVADELESRARERHWLPLALIACDEPVGAAVGEAARRLADLPRIDPRRLVQWSVTTSLGPRAPADVRTLIGQISLPFLSEFSPEEIRFPWAYYNAASRKTVGLGMFRLRRTTDLRYRLLWVWNQNLGNPYFDFDGRENDAAWCASTADERLRCSVELDRVVDRGLTDYRVALGLKRVLDERTDLSRAQREQGLDLLKEAQSEDADADAWLLKAGEYQERL